MAISPGSLGRVLLPLTEINLRYRDAGSTAIGHNHPAPLFTEQVYRRKTPCLL
jgi:hypothetical protein